MVIWKSWANFGNCLNFQSEDTLYKKVGKGREKNKTSLISSSWQTYEITGAEIRSNKVRKFVHIHTTKKWMARGLSPSMFPGLGPLLLYVIIKNQGRMADFMFDFILINLNFYIYFHFWLICFIMWMPQFSLMGT